MKKRSSSNAISITAAIFLLTCLMVAAPAFADTRTWIGAGAGGSGTDFNNAANWNPVGTPTLADDIVITLTSSATIQLSGDAEINSLVFKSSTSNQTAILDINGFDLVINAATSIEGNPGTARIGENGVGSGSLFFKGSFAITSSSNGAAALLGNATSKAVFYDNVSINLNQNPNSNTQNSNVVFDAVTSQSITWNSNANINFRNVTIGGENNPTVNLAGNVYGTINAISGDMTVKGGAVLNMNNKFWNTLTNTSAFTLADSSGLIVTQSNGGIGSSNFPAGFGSYSLAKKSTVNYTGGHVQELPGGAKYGNLQIGGNTQSAGTAVNLKVAGNLFITAARQFDLQGKHLQLEGDWINNGTFIPNNGQVTLNGSEDQNITGSSVTNFRFLTINKPSGGATVLTNADVEEKLTLTKGLITTGNFRVRVGNKNYLGSIDGGDNNSYVNGRLEKGIVNWSSGQIGLGFEHFFPVGKGGNYRPVFLNISSMSAASWVSVEQFETGFLGTPPVDYYTPNRYWDVDILDANTFNFTLRLDGTDTPFSSDTKMLRYNPIATTTDVFNTTLSLPYYSSSNITANSHFALSPNNADMPVTLTDFHVTSLENVVKLNWSTSSEEKSDKFEIERSTNPAIGFEQIGTKPSQNEPNGASYSFTDQTIPRGGILYYRLKIVDFDGSFEYSNIKSIATSEIQNSFIYPNPALHQVRINTSNLTDVVFVSVHDLTGRQLLKREGSESQKDINVSSLSSGLYFAKVVDKHGQTHLLKFVVQK